MENEHRENTTEPSLNDKPYYSEDNGFAWATALRGMPEALPGQINIIVRNKQWEIVKSYEQLQVEINDLDQKKKNLERKIAKKEKAQAEKEVKLTKLKVKLELPAAELNSQPGAEHFPESSDKLKIEEQIARLSKKLMRLEKELEAPTEAELNPSPDVGPEEEKVPLIQFIRGFFNTVIRIFRGEQFVSDIAINRNIAMFPLIFLCFYIFIFYASAVDMAYFQGAASLINAPDIALNTIINIVNPTAFFKAFWSPVNLVVLFCPSIFFGFAIMARRFWIQGKLGLLGTTLLANFLMNGILAIQISQRIHQIKQIRGLILDTMAWSFRINDLSMWSIIFFGFVVSAGLSPFYHYVIEHARAMRPFREKSKQLDLRISAEKNPKEVRLVTLETRIANLQNRFNYLDKFERHPIKVDIKPLEAKTQNLKNEIEALNREVESTKNEMEALSQQLRESVIARNRIESQVNEFMRGWCRYIVQSETKSTAATQEKIEKAHQVAKDTLDRYFSTLANRSRSARASSPILEQANHPDQICRTLYDT